jgi:hypothetical protein
MSVLFDILDLIIGMVIVGYGIRSFRRMSVKVGIPGAVVRDVTGKTAQFIAGAYIIGGLIWVIASVMMIAPITDVPRDQWNRILLFAISIVLLVNLGFTIALAVAPRKPQQ